jgi:hypothetical protein
MYYAKGEMVLRHLEEDSHAFECGDAYARASWRYEVPARKETGVRDEDVDLHREFVQFHNDVSICKINLPEFNLDMTDYDFLLEKVRNEQTLMKELEEHAYYRAKRSWESKNKEFVENKRKQEEHRFHKPRSYYIALFESDPMAKEWYGGEIPNNEETCEICKQKKQYEEAQKPKYVAPVQSIKEEVTEVKVPVVQSDPPFRHHCEMCDYHCYHKVELAVHLKSREHRQAEKEYEKSLLYCDCCDVRCRTKLEYDNHIATQKHKKKQEGFSGFCCEKCDYKTNRRCNYDRHLASKKHLGIEEDESRADTSGDDL